MMSEPIVIISALRTPMGSLLGQLSQCPAPLMTAELMKATLSQLKIESSFFTEFDETIIGSVLPANRGQAPARQASIFAPLPHHVGATTINKMCGSGMKAILRGFDKLIACVETHAIFAGGMENMSLAPYLLPQARQGYRLGHASFIDHLFFDGLEDAYNPGKLMGWFAEESAKKLSISRQMQDEVALESFQRAPQAQKNGFFSDEIVPIKLQDKSKGEYVIKEDEPISKVKPEKISSLKPVFQENETITAASSSSIADGASICLLMREKETKNLNIQLLDKIIGHATFSDKPELFPETPSKAITACLKKVGWSLSQVDLFEINEAFAVVTLGAIKALDLDPSKVNINGGARIITTLIHALKRTKGKKGIASLCIGGGEATTVAIKCY